MVMYVYFAVEFAINDLILLLGMAALVGCYVLKKLKE